MNTKLLTSYLRRCAAVLLLFTAVACQNNGERESDKPSPEAAEDPRIDFTIVPGERVGLITTETASKAEVLAAYGDLAREDSVYLGEGFYGPGLLLFPEEKRNTAEVYWDTSVDTERPAFIRIYGSEGQTDWQTETGITIGSTLEKVEAINGAPFRMYGFEWDYGGFVSDWKGGQITDNLSLRFNPREGVESPETILGDITLSSDNDQLRQSSPVVSELIASFPRSNLLPLMEGSWQSVTDGGYIIQISEGEIRHYTNDRLMYTATIEPDEGCMSAPCKATGNQPEGFCFLEKGAQGDEHCNLVLSVDEQRLEYSAIGTTGSTLAFERIEE